MIESPEMSAPFSAAVGAPLRRQPLFSVRTQSCLEGSIRSERHGGPAAQLAVLTVKAQLEPADREPR